MRLVTVVCFVLVLALCATALADFTLFSTIPAPRPCPLCPVLGLTSNGTDLFVTAATDTSQWFYLIDPNNGDILYSHEWDLHGQFWPRFEAASYEGVEMYWVAESNGDLIRFLWVDGMVSVVDTVSESRVTYPRGMVYRPGGEATGDNLVADAEFDSLFAVGILGGVSDAKDLGQLTFLGTLNPTSAAEYGGHYFFGSEDYQDSVFESDAGISRVQAHFLPLPAEFVPQAATFHNGLYYVGGYGDSLIVYSMGSYADSVPEGPGISVEIVPEGLTISFDSVATAGSLFVEEIIDTCPALGGVAFFGDFYDVSTTAEFDYITTVEMMTNTPLPNGIMPRRVRVFKRPSGACTYWRDITVRGLQIEPPAALVEPFRVNSRTLSEDDEFSVFTLGEDNRNPRMVIGLKYGFLEDAITSNQDSIPTETYDALLSMLTNSQSAYDGRRYGQAARLADRIANTTRSTPAIPHRYEPGTGRINVAGRIIARAHTLAFSLRLLLEEIPFGSGGAKSVREPTRKLEPAPMNSLIVGPNPSANGFTIRLSGTARHPVSVKVYSVEGQIVATLLDGGFVIGERSFTWDGRNQSGEPVSAGAYFVVVTEGENTTTRKVVLRK